MKAQTEQFIAGRYSLEGSPAKIGSVELHNAFDLQLGRAVTLQMLSEERARDTAVTQAFLDHQRTASSIYHCAVLAVYDVGTLSGRPFSVIERRRGISPAELFLPERPPDAATVLRIARQSAEALHCCRDAGLSDWTFSPEAVDIDAEGNARLAIIEGLGGEESSSSASDDVAVLGGLIGILLAGRPDVTPSTLQGNRAAEPILSLIERLQADSPNRFAGAGEVAEEIARLEEVSLQPTQTYEPDRPTPTPIHEEHGVSHQIPAPVLLDPSEAPTLVAQALPSDPPGMSRSGTRSPHESRKTPRQAKLFPYFSLAILATGLLLAATVAALGSRPPVTLPPIGRSVSGLASPGTPSAPATVPDLRGQGLDSARGIAAGVGLTLTIGAPITDLAFPLDTVAGQAPEPGAALLPGSPITVSLNLAPNSQSSDAPEVSPLTPGPDTSVEPRPGADPPKARKGRDKDKKGRDGDEDH